jgi:hypoxanthine phosphoribosyltransferase
MTAGLRCQLVSIETVYELAYDLARRVREDHFIPDLVVAISRGGFTPARVLCDVLGIFNLTSIRVVHYRMAATKEQTAHVEYPLCIPVAGLRVLVVDDVNDSGDTLQVACGHLESLGSTEVRTAVLHEKTSSPIRADYVAAAVTEWRWLIYPWAVVEDVGGFLRQMSPPPVDVAEAADRLAADYDLKVPEQQLQRLLEIVQQEHHP